MIKYLIIIIYSNLFFYFFYLLNSIYSFGYYILNIIQLNDKENKNISWLNLITNPLQAASQPSANSSCRNTCKKELL